jgi:hypothetical protein
MAVEAVPVAKSIIFLPAARSIVSTLPLYSFYYSFLGGLFLAEPLGPACFIKLLIYSFILSESFSNSDKDVDADLYSSEAYIISSTTLNIL